MLAFVLEDGLRTVTVVAAAVIASITASSLVWRKIVRPARIKTQEAFTEAVVAANAKAIEEAIAPVAAQVKDMHGRLSKHLIEEGAEMAGIHQQSAETNDRVGKVEESQTEILKRIDQLGNQVATDSANIVHAIQNPEKE